jgi:hypothetical protein
MLDPVNAKSSGMGLYLCYTNLMITLILLAGISLYAWRRWRRKKRTAKEVEDLFVQAGAFILGILMILLLLGAIVAIPIIGVPILILLVICFIAGTCEAYTKN